MQLSRNVKTFSEYFSAFFDSTLNFEYFAQKIILIPQGCLKLMTPKDVFT